MTRGTAQTTSGGRTRRRRGDLRRTACWVLILSFALTAGLAAVAGAFAPDAGGSTSLEIERSDAELAEALSTALAPVARARSAAASVAAPTATSLTALPPECTPTTPDGDFLPQTPDISFIYINDPPIGCCPNDNDCDGLVNDLESEVFDEWWNGGSPTYPYRTHPSCFFGGQNESSDSDCDGLTDGWEYWVTKTKIFDHDTDDGDIDDGIEVLYLGTDPLDPADDPVDSDGDGLPDVLELEVLGSDPFKADTDEDGLSDWEEFRLYGSDPTNPDSDGDGLNDFEEVSVHYTDPTNPDTDGGGEPDGDEVAAGRDPLWPGDDLIIDTGVSVVAVRTDRGDGTGDVVITWGDVPDGVAEIAVRRNGVPAAIAAAGVGRATDTTAPVDAIHTYEIVGGPVGGPWTTVIDTVQAIVPLTSYGCTLSWTGVLGFDWQNDRNWADVLAPGAPVPGAQRVPGESDHPCVQVKGAVPATSAVEVPKLAGLTIEDADVELAGDVTVPEVRNWGGSLSVAGSVVVDTLLVERSFTGAGSITVGSLLQSTTAVVSAPSVVVEATATYQLARTGNEVFGDLSVNGAVQFVASTPPPGFSALSVIGDLDLFGGSSLTMRVGDDGSDVIGVSGAVALGGTLTVNAVGTLTQPVDAPLVYLPASISGAFTTVTVPSGTALATDTFGLWLRGNPTGGGGDECAAVPDVGGQPVGGCWTAQGGGTFLTNRTVGEGRPVPSIGSLYLQPDPGVDLVLYPDGELAAFTPSRAPGRVALATVIVTPDDKTGFRAVSSTGPAPGTPVGVVDLGSRLIERWDLTQPLSVNPPSVVGLRTNGASSIQMVDERDVTGWALGLNASLPGILGGGAVQLPLFAGLDGVPSDTVRLTDLVGVFGAIAGLTGLDLTWVAGEVWEFANGVADDLQIEGSIDFDVTRGTGTLTVTGLSIGEVFAVDDFTMTLRIDGDVETWSYLATGDQRLRELTIAHQRGTLIAGRVELGDVADTDDKIPSALVAGELIDVRGVVVTYDRDDDVWLLAGLMHQPSTEVRGYLDFDGGALVGGALDLTLELGSLAQLDIDASFDVGGTWSLDVFLRGAGFENRSASGLLVFDGGNLVAGRITIEELPIGELVTIHSFALWFDRPAGDWKLEGRVSTSPGSGDGFDISGALRFDDGVLVAARIELGRFELGPSTVDRLIIDLDRSGPAPGPRTATYLVSGWISGSSDGTSVPQEPLTGSMSILDGRITAMTLGIPSLSIGNLAHLTDATFGYAYDSDTDTATVTGAGTLRTADGTTESAATLEVELIDTVLQSATITADRLGFGGALAIDDLELRYDRNGDPASCDGVPKTVAGTKLWAARGSVATDRDGHVAVDGCLAMVDRAVVAGFLRVGDIVVDELFRIVEVELTVADHSFDEQDLTGSANGSVRIGGTTFGISAQFATANSSTAVTGSMRIEDGGLAALSIELDDVPLLTLFTVEDLRLDYDAGPRWDTTVDATFALSGTVRHGEGTSSLDGSVTFDRDGGSISSLAIAAMDVPFGPANLDRIAFAYDDKGGAGAAWAIAGEITLDSGDTFELDGSLTIENGRVRSLSLQVPRLPVGELILLHDVRFSYSRTVDGVETWNGTARVPQPDGSQTSATIDLVIGADQRFSAGRVEVAEIGWAGLFHVEQLVLDGVRSGTASSWSVLGQLSVAGGPSTRVSGALTIDDGKVRSGQLNMTDLAVADLVRIEELDLSVTPGDEGSWSAVLALRNGATGTGSMRFEDGRLSRADLFLGSVEVGELLRLDALRIVFDAGRSWSASATVADEDGTSTLAGSLTFNDGQVTAGSLSMANVQLGPIDLQSFQLSLATTVVVDGVTRQASSVCDVPEPLVIDGRRWAVQAVVRTSDGDTRAIGGRIRLDGNRITDAVLCGSNVQIADMIVLQDFQIGFSRSSGDDVWTGSVTVADPEAPNDPATASLTFRLLDRQLRMLDLTAEGLNFGNLLSLRQVELSYDRNSDDALWSLSAELGRPGGTPGSIAGSLEIVDGVIVAGSLSVEDLPFGDAFTLTDLEIDYVGRRARSTPWPNGLPTGLISLTEDNDCGTTPSGSNVPSGTPTTTGGESYFRVAAAVEANGEAFAVGGSLSFADGRLTSFDVTLDCVPLGSWMMLQDVRILYSESSDFILTGRLEDDDPATADPRFFGRASFQNGRLSGGQLSLGGIGLGATTLESFNITLGQQPNGTSVWAASLTILDADDRVVGGSASITIDEGRIVAGSIDIPTIPIADLLVIQNVSLGFDDSVPGEFRIWGSGGLTVASGSGGSVAIDLRFREGKLVAGTFSAGALKLFDIIPVGSFFLSFDSDTKSWTAALSVSVGAGGGPPGPGIQAGIEVRNGKLISGIIGFDADGDGSVDAPDANGDAPASGAGDFAGLPLRAFYLRYCAEASSAPFCGPGLEDTWDGRITIEFPTEAAPSLDAQLRIKNGKFAAAFIELGLPAPGIPIFTGVFLNSLQASLELDPRLRFCGGLGITVGPSTLTVARLTAAIEFSEEPLPYDPPPPALCELTPPGEVPDDWEPEYLRFLIQGVAELFPGNPLNIDITGQTYLELQTRGYLGAGANFNVEFINNLLGVEGYAEGSLFNANSVPATNPRTGQPLTGAVVQLKGGVAAQILGKNIAEADFVVNTIGAAGCAAIDLVLFSPRVGAGFYWAGGDRLTCDLGQFEIIVPNTISFSSSGSGTSPLRRALPTSVVAEFTVAPGERLLGVEVLGDGGAPDVSLIGPDGTVLRFDETDIETTGHLVSTTDTKRYFVVAMPATGTWRVETNDGSLPVLSTTTYFELPTPEVTGSVTPGPDGYELDVEVLDIPGQEVVFVEREAGGTGVLGGIGTWLSPTGAIGTSMTSFDFLPGGSASGGPREIVALVWQDGFQRDEIVVATYDAPDATPASAPTAIVATEVPGGATVTWEPPVDHGGREITGYRITSTTGFAVTVGPEARTATIAIPMMTPGEVVPVIVTARTGVGWGEPGWAEVVSTQTTGPTYALALLQAPDPDDPGSTTTSPTTTPPTTTSAGSGGGGPTTTSGGTTAPGPVTTVVPTRPTDVTPTFPSDGQPPVPSTPLDGRLPATGGDSRRAVSIAIVLVAAGLSVVLTTRRRRSAAEGRPVDG